MLNPAAIGPDAALPFSLLSHRTLCRDVPAGKLITLDDLDMPEESTLLRLRREQDRAFGLMKQPPDPPPRAGDAGSFHRQSESSLTRNGPDRVFRDAPQETRSRRGPREKGAPPRFPPFSGDGCPPRQ